MHSPPSRPGTLASPAGPPRPRRRECGRFGQTPTLQGHGPPARRTGHNTIGQGVGRTHWRGWATRHGEKHCPHASHGTHCGLLAAVGIIAATNLLVASTLNRPKPVAEEIRGACKNHTGVVQGLEPADKCDSAAHLSKRVAGGR